MTPATKGRENPHPKNGGQLLYYSRAVEPTYMIALGSTAANQSKINETTSQAIKQLLYYCATHPYAIIRYKQSNMVLHVHSYSLYFLGYQARVQDGGHYVLWEKTFNQSDNNGAILAISYIIKNVMASASESECADLFIKSRDAIVIRNTLEET